MAGRIVIVGSLNADLVVRVDQFPSPGETVHGWRFERFPGGKGANQAFGVGRLGGRAQMVGLVGDDGHGEWLRDSLASAGVDVSTVARVSHVPTGVAIITVDATGQNEIVIVGGANAAMTPDRLASSAAVLRSAALVLLQLEIPTPTVAAAIEIAAGAGARVMLDPAPARELSSDLLRSIDILTPNEPELAALTGGGAAADDEQVVARARRLLQAGARHVVVKRGASGATLVSASGARHWPAARVEVVDTTAAGDAFNAALAVALAEGAAIDDAIPFAIGAASISVTRPGAQTSMPTRGEVDRHGRE